MKTCNCVLPYTSPLGFKVCKGCSNSDFYEDYDDTIPFCKENFDMILISKERYNKLLEIEAMYNDLCK